MSHPANLEEKAPYARQKCLIDGCPHLEELVKERCAGGLCSGHRYRKKKGLPLEGPLHEGLGRRLSPRQALLEAALGLVDAPDTGDATVARRPMERLTHAALVYAKARRRGSR